MAAMKTRPKGEPSPNGSEAGARAEDPRDARIAELEAQLGKAERPRSEAREQRLAKEREALVASGELVVTESGAEFVRANGRKKDQTKQRAAQLLECLRASDDPLVAKKLEAEIGGGSSFYIAFFAMLESLELIDRFCVLGERQAAYKWIGPR